MTAETRRNQKSINTPEEVVVIITVMYTAYSNVLVLRCMYITVNDTQYIMNGNRKINEMDVRNEMKSNITSWKSIERPHTFKPKSLITLYCN